MNDKSTGKTKPIVVVAEPLAESGLAVLRSGGLEVHEAADREQLEPLIARAHALIVRSKTKVTGALLDAAPSLQVVGRAGVGVDTIDVEAATRAGIVVLNTPDASTLATTEHTLTLMLALCRHVGAGQKRVEERRWSAQGLLGEELAGKTLGIVGLGRIGAAVAARARAFGMTILAHDAVVSEARAESLGVKLVPLSELLEQSDFVTLHTPLTPQTQGLIGEPELARMKRGARIINCARGGLIDERALLAALESGHIAGAAIDVVAEEPPKPDAAIWTLLNHPRVVATPHLGGSTREAQDRIAADLGRDVVAVLRGRPPSGAVNAPVKAPPEVRPFVELAFRLGAAFPQISDAENLSHFDLVLEGDLSNYDGLPFAVSFLVGLLPHLTDERAAAVNAPEGHTRIRDRCAAARPPAHDAASRRPRHRRQGWNDAGRGAHQYLGHAGGAQRARRCDYVARHRSGPRRVHTQAAARNRGCRARHGYRAVRLVLVRHGESTWNIEGRYQWRVDPPLSPPGTEQAKH